MCSFLWGGGGDDKDVMFEFGEAVAWACGVEAW